MKKIKPIVKSYLWVIWIREYSLKGILIESDNKDKEDGIKCTLSISIYHKRARLLDPR